MRSTPPRALHPSRNLRAIGASPANALSFPLRLAFTLFVSTAAFSTVRAGDLLRGGAAPGSSARIRASESQIDATAAKVTGNASDALARTTQAVESVRALQETARQVAASRNSLNLNGQALPAVPNGLRPGGLEVAPDVAAGNLSLWKGAKLPTQHTNALGTNVIIQQQQPTAILNWKTFNVGKNTNVIFNQTIGGERKAEWIAFNKISDPSGRPSQILGSIKADGQVYLINQNGIIFGGSSVIDVHTLVASTLPINDNLIRQGLLNNRDAQFLFSALPVPGGSDGTPAFNPTITDPEFNVSVGAETYTLRQPLAVDAVDAPLRRPELSVAGVKGSRTVLIAGTDYIFTVESATNQGSATFTAAGLAKVNNAPVRVVYTPAVINSGDVVVQAGARLTSPVSADGNGGRLMFVAPNVTNAGTLAAPAGQTILAAGQQVGVVAHASTDPSLRGLDVFVGAVGGSTGAVTNTGLIEAFRGSVSLSGRSVNQLGVIDSSTSVDLNGRIDLRASYGAVGNPQFDNGGAGSGGPPFAFQSTGVVSFGGNSVTRILPEYDSDKAVPGTALPERSQINVEGKVVNFRANSLLLAPNGKVSVRAGIWPYQDSDGNRTTLGADGNAQPGLGSLLSGRGQTFLFDRGQIYVDQFALIDVAGSTEVFVPLTHSILEVAFRGSELADSPLQRTGILRNVPLTVDLRRTGAYDGRFWMGTPLGDATGLAGLIQRNVAQLTARGGDVTMQAGQSIVLQKGATVDVSGGTFRHEAGLVKTTRLLQDGRLVDIADALPDRTYDSIYTGTFTVDFPKYGFSETFASPLASGEHFEPSYVEGAAGGAVKLTAPSMAIDGTLRGVTVQGNRQRALPPEHSSLSFKFAAEQRVDTASTISFLPSSPTPPVVTFGDWERQRPVEAFRLVGDDPVALPRDRITRVVLSPTLLSEDGFGKLSVENTDGDIVLPGGVKIAAQPLGTLSLVGANVAVRGEVTAPGGTLDFRALNISPAFAAVFNLAPGLQAPAPVVGRGLFFLASGASLSTAGLIVDDRLNAASPGADPLAIDGGAISITAYGAQLQSGSTVDVSGGVAVSARGATSYGSGGSISIRAGKDPDFAGVLGGQLELRSTLAGYSGGKGGTLTVQATAIQVGGTPSFPNTLLLQPEFFRQGGFTSYALEGIGAPSDEPFGPGGPDPYAPAITIAPGTLIAPVAERLLALPNQLGSREIVLQRQLLPAGQRSAVDLSFTALGADDPLTIEKLEARGDLVMGSGARIVTDPGAKVSFKGDTITLLGAVSAPGGTITVAGRSSFRVVGAAAEAETFGRPTVYIGPQTVLSAAGTSVSTPDAFGRRLGTIFPGGTISISGNIVADAGSLFDVSGATTVFDVHPTALGIAASPIVPVESGLTSPLWRLQSVPTRVDSDGGTIELTGSQMLYSDATLLGRAGGPTALGGTLSIFSGRFYSFGAARTSADINLVVTQNRAAIPIAYQERGVGLRVGSETGIGYFAADRFALGGFNSLDLGAKFLESASPIPFGGNIEFRGPVSIAAPGSLRVAGGGIIQADSTVSLTGSYVAVGQPFRKPLLPNPTTTFSPFLQNLPTVGPFNVTPVFGPGAITIQGDFIETGFLSFQNIGKANLIAAGDIRGNGTLNLAGDLSLRAGQIYPTTVGDFTIVAYDKNIVVASSATGNSTVTLASAVLPPGFRVGASLLGSTVTKIEGTAVTLAAGANASVAAATPINFAGGSITISSAGRPQEPLSAGGKLSIYASRIVQGGTLRAPLGGITLGWDGTDTDPSDAALDQPLDAITGARLSIPVANQVLLKAGSLTSVAAVDFGSGFGFVIPFGLSPDGLSWIDPRGVNITANGAPQKSVSIAGNNVTTEAGSVIDIRGGGDLLAYRWIPGAGGSIDILGSGTTPWADGTAYQPGDLVTFGGKTWSARVRNSGERPVISLFWSEVQESFAVIAGYQSPVAPYAVNSVAQSLDGDPGYVSSKLHIGDRITISKTPGLSAGTYTLLPARYALLPGAFLVTPTAKQLRGETLLLDGSTIAPGYQSNRFNQPEEVSPLRAQFKISPFDTYSQRAEYATYLGNEFFKAAAERLDIDQPQELPGDAGYLAFQGNSGLRLEGQVLTSHALRARGASIDVSSFGDIFIIGGSGQAPVGAGVVLRTSVLESWGAESLLIGGLRRQSATGTIVDVRAENLTLNNPRDAFAGPEIILAANDDLTLAPGSRLVQAGRLTSPAETLLPQGRSQLEASGDALTFTSGGVPIGFPNGTRGNNQITTTVAGVITLANGTRQTLAANTPTVLPVGSTLSLDTAGEVRFASGTGGPIPLRIGDGVLVRVTSDPAARIVRSGVAGSTAPTLTVGAGASVSGTNVTLDSTYGTVLDPTASLRAEVLTLGSGQISILLQPTAVLTGATVDPQLVLSGRILEDIQRVKALTLRSSQSIDLYGAGTFGETIRRLSLVGSGLRGFDQAGGTAVIAAGTVRFDNPSNFSAPTAPAVVSGALEVAAGEIVLGENGFAITGYENVGLKATGGVLGEGKNGSLTTPGNLTITTPLITGEGGTTQAITAGGDLVLARVASAATVEGGLGSSFTFSGKSVVADSDVILPSGRIILRATGSDADDDVTVGGTLNVAGTQKEFFDLIRYSSAGTITLASKSGDVTLSPGSTVSVAAPAAGGSAGTITVNAGSGAFTSTGAKLLGGAAIGETAGSFVLDAGTLASFADLSSALNDGGFFEQRNLRIRTGDIVIADVAGRANVAHDFTVSTDTGNITVQGTIDASWRRGLSAEDAAEIETDERTGGKISLIAGGSLILENGAVLTANAEVFSHAGRGGSISLEAGAVVNGVANTAATLDIRAGSKLDLSVDAFVAGAYTDPGSSAFGGKFTGTLHLRAPRTGGGAGNGIAISTIGGEILGASSVFAEGFKVYTVTGVDGTITSALQTQIRTEGQTFLGTSGQTVANYTAMFDALVGAQTDAVKSAFVLAPGAEIVNLDGNVTLGTANSTSTSDWSLTGTTAATDFRFGPKRAPGVLTIRASRDLVFNNTLSDGFVPVASSVNSGNSTMWLAPLRELNPDLPLNTQSWSFRLAAGSDAGAADFNRVRSVEDLTGGSTPVGSVLVGKVFTLSTAGTSATLTRTQISNRFQVIRTGAGNIDIAAGLNFQLRNQFSTVYTAGVRVPTSSETTMSIFTPDDFVIPDITPTFQPPSSAGNLGVIQQLYDPQWSLGGGHVSISAGANITHGTTTLQGRIIPDSTAQLPMNWLYRRGLIDPSTGLFSNGFVVETTNPQTSLIDPAASTSWWIDYSNFFQGIGTLGGGDVKLVAGNDVINVDAVAPTNARMAGRVQNPDGTFTNLAPDAAKLVEWGGGDIVIRAGRNIDGGVYYAERGEGKLIAGGSVTTNESRSPANIGGTSSQFTWLPTTLFLGKGSFDVSARGDVLLGPVVNPFLLPQGLNNRYWYKSYFDTYSPDASLTVASFGGSVTHRLGASTDGNTSVEPLLTIWMRQKHLIGQNTLANSQPWIRLGEGTSGNINAFTTAVSVLPPTLRSTAFAGDVNVVGRVNLYPAPRGTLELAASGGVIGLQPAGITQGFTNYTAASINVSDANPDAFNGVTSPLGFQNLVGNLANPLLGVNTLNYQPLLSFNQRFAETGAFTGLASSIAVQGPLHAAGLHAGDSQPIRLYALGSDITGLTLYSPKFTEVVAANDITDVAFYIQNVSAGDVSLISAGRDIIPFNENGALRAFANDNVRNIVGDVLKATVAGSSTAALAGDLQINGPGVLEVIAGRNLDLGNGANFADGTGVGLTSIGASRNPFLPLQGADIIALAGVSGSNGLPALGLTGSTLDFGSSGQGTISAETAAASRYLSQLGVAAGAGGLTDEQQAIVAIEEFFRTLRDSGRAAATTSDYSAGLAAIAALFGDKKPLGEILTRARDIRTTKGGAISLLAPGGGVTLASDIFGNPLTPPGIVTEFGGPISVFTDGSVDIGQARIFTLRGGDIVMWSSTGDIAAGNAPRTVATAPPTRVLIDATSANVQTDLGGLATGGGIGVLAAVVGVPPGDVDLIAPSGVVDAGDAGIRSTGNLTIAATAVLNAGNIQVAGTSSGVPSVAPPAAPALSSAPPPPPPTNTAGPTAADDVKRREEAQTEADSIIDVEILSFSEASDAGAAAAAAARPVSTPEPVSEEEERRRRQIQPQPL